MRCVRLLIHQVPSETLAQKVIQEVQSFYQTKDVQFLSVVTPQFAENIQYLPSETIWIAFFIFRGKIYLEMCETIRKIKGNNTYIPPPLIDDEKMFPNALELLRSLAQNQPTRWIYHDLRQGSVAEKTFLNFQSFAKKNHAPLSWCALSQMTPFLSQEKHHIQGLIISDGSHLAAPLHPLLEEKMFIHYFLRQGI